MANCSKSIKNSTLFEIVTSFDHDIDQLPCLKVSIDGFTINLLFNILERRIEEFIDVPTLALFYVGGTRLFYLMHSFIRLM
jgi:hypothetical protein